MNAMLLAKVYPRCNELSENQKKHYYTDILRQRMDAYFDSYDVIYAGVDQVDLSEMKVYQKLPMTLGYIVSTDIGKPGEMIRIRKLEGDMEMSCQPNMCIMIGVKGDIYPMFKEKFEVSYVKEEGPYEVGNLDYTPKVHNATTGEVIELLPHAKRCVSSGGVRIYAKKLDRTTKVFTEWNPDNYMFATPDDYLAVRMDDVNDVYIIDQDIFPASYELCE